MSVAMEKDAPEVIEAHGTFYDRRDTVDELSQLLADARRELAELRNPEANPASKDEG